MQKVVNKITLILRDYTLEAATIVAREANKYNCFSIEIAMNTISSTEIIKQLIANNYSSVTIGAGTVTNLNRLFLAKSAGARFVLSPVNMSEQMIEYCKINHIVSVPGAYTPSEIFHQFEIGADIVKVFPAHSLSPKYYKDIMAPLGHLPLMVVGGINVENVKQYFESSVDYAGIGSGICNKQTILKGDRTELIKNLEFLSKLA